MVNYVFICLQAVFLVFYSYLNLLYPSVPSTWLVNFRYTKHVCQLVSLKCYAYTTRLMMGNYLDVKDIYIYEYIIWFILYSEEPPTSKPPHLPCEHASPISFLYYELVETTQDPCQMPLPLRGLKEAWLAQYPPLLSLLLDHLAQL